MNAARLGKLAVLTCLGAFLFFSVLSFLTLLPEGLQFVLTVLSISFMLYILVTVGLSDALFGKENRWASLALVACSAVLSARPLLLMVDNSTPPGVLRIIVDVMLSSFNDTTVYGLGFIMLFALSAIIALFVPVKSPSVAAMLGESGRAKTIASLARRIILVFLLFATFYTMIFDVTLQWWRILTETTSVVFVLIILFLAALKHERKMSWKSFLIALETLDSNAYSLFVGLFHKSSTVLFGVAALLVFYPLSDLGTFLIPYVLNIPNNVFLSLSTGMHLPLPVLAYQAISANAITGSMVSLVYVLNAIAAVMVLLLPAIFWYRMFKGKHLNLSPIAGAVFVASVAAFLIAPAFTMTTLSERHLSLLGVDIQSIPVSVLVTPLALGTAITAGALSLWLGRRKPVAITLIIIAIVVAFLSKYLYLYFSDIWKALLGDAIATISVGGLASFLAGTLLLVFLGISVIASIGAFSAYVYELCAVLWKEKYVRKLWRTIMR